MRSWVEKSESVISIHWFVLATGIWEERRGMNWWTEIKRNKIENNRIKEEEEDEDDEEEGRPPPIRSRAARTPPALLRSRGGSRTSGRCWSSAPSAACRQSPAPAAALWSAPPAGGNELGLISLMRPSSFCFIRVGKKVFPAFHTLLVL